MSFIPIISAEDLGIYLNDADLDTVRAQALIEDAQLLCETIISPLPPNASVVVKRVAGRAYVTVMSARQVQLQAGGSPYAGTQTGGVWLSRSDKADLRRLVNGTGGAFSVNLLPADWTATVPPWDVNVVDP